MNNDWRIMNATLDSDPDFDYENEPLHYIHPNMRIKLLHISTGKHLHSHDIRPPVSDVDFQNEVSGYGMPGFQGDANDDWIVEIAEGDTRDVESFKRLRTLRTKFRLRHMLTGCYLFSHKVKLPEWGYEQQEVTCNKNAVKENSLWYIETSEHPQLPPDAPKVNYKLPGFLGKFLELQKVMWTTNAGLTDRHAFDSRPDSWPRLRRGINFWVKDHKQIYLMGNPMIWWSSTLAVGLYALIRGLLILRQKRGFRDFDNTKVVKYDTLCSFLFIGWSLHYFPFFLMARQLFLHHYFPALYFSILLYCAIFDLVTSSLRPRVRLQVAGVLVVLAVWNFGRFAPLVYGSEWTRGRCEGARWVKSWDFSCVDFYDEYAQYSAKSMSATKDIGIGTSPAIVPPVGQGGPINGGRGGPGPLVVDEKVAQANVENLQKQNQAAAQDFAHNNGDGDVHTVIDPGRPEPGRDIFAGEGGEVKSDTLAVNSPHHEKQGGGGGGDEVGAGGEEGEGGEKEISSVNVHAVTTGTERDAAEEKERERERKEESTVARGLGGGTASTFVSTTTRYPAKEAPPHAEEVLPAKEEEEVKVEEKVEKKDEQQEPSVDTDEIEIPMGPHDEAGEAREKVAEELFGDAEDE
ncbi:hypothetical protein NP233_g10676 [Leucocoprinus birnbaumii]|uniref:Dolichyl-phosphate-mannose--protein mannosyltransferase n=1 Tax=Leucocoprinus birnbaumii TaxID=56174 RepID=A0AAD5YPL7_9AGAR|nr:hypothetical protein NP233_g10676 [Leucocoprinus birnbaumii]